MASPSGFASISAFEMDRDNEIIQDPSSSTSMGMTEVSTSTRSVSRSNKALAAVSGAVMTSITMTPFDVIKTRLQTQSAPEPLFQPSKRSPPNITCCQSTLMPTVNEASAVCRFDPRTETRTNVATSSSPVATYPGSRRRPRSAPNLNHPTNPRPRLSPSTLLSSNSMSAAACAYPDREVAARELQAVASESRLSGLWDGVVKVRRNEGVRGLWRGLSPTLMMTVPSQVTYMTCYDHFRVYFLSLGPEIATSGQPSFSNVSLHTLSSSLAAGALARSASATLVTPLELLRTRLQATSSSYQGNTRSLGYVLRDLGHQVSREGPSVLFRGLVATLYRDVPFSAIYFAGYESIKRILTGSGLGEHSKENAMRARQGPSEEFATAFFSGASSGMFAAVVTQPFDLVKTRLQAKMEIRGVQRAGAITAGDTNMIGLMREIIQKEGGFRALFSGLTPRVAKVAPACGIMIGSFEVVGKWLEGNM